MQTTSPGKAFRARRPAFDSAMAKHLILRELVAKMLLVDLDAGHQVCLSTGVMPGGGRHPWNDGSPTQRALQDGQVRACGYDFGKALGMVQGRSRRVKNRGADRWLGGHRVRAAIAEQRGR